MLHLSDEQVLVLHDGEHILLQLTEEQVLSLHDRNGGGNCKQLCSHRQTGTGPGFLGISSGSIPTRP